MHYLLTVIGDTDNPADDSAPGAIDAFNDRLKEEGRWVFAGGLTDPQDATVTDSRGGEPVFTDGPFVESKEYLAGFWVITADDGTRISDEVAVVAYRVHEDMTVDGKPLSLDAADTSVWVRKGGRWLCTVHTESLSGDPFGRDRVPAR